MGAFDGKGLITLPDPANPEAAAAFRKEWGWDDNELVILKAKMTVRDQKSVTNSYAKTGKDGQIETRAGEGRFAILPQMIVSWTFTQDGQVLPVTPANIDELPSNYSNAILEAIDKISTPPGKQAQTDFLNGANAPIEASSEQTKTHPKK